MASVCCSELLSFCNDCTVIVVAELLSLLPLAAWLLKPQPVAASYQEGWGGGWGDGARWPEILLNNYRSEKQYNHAARDMQVTLMSP